MEKQYFAGANTPMGFFSYFQHLVNPLEANRIYILKGGSGVGKSTAMKTFGAHLKSQGYPLEYIYCSADAKSLDAVYCPALKVVMVDGTAPHIIDPLLPGATETIVNLGAFLNINQLKEQKTEISHLLKEKATHYQNAYAYMKSAHALLEMNQRFYDEILDLYAFQKECAAIAQGIFPMDFGAMGTFNKAFAEAFTPEGFVDVSPSLTQGMLCYTFATSVPYYVGKALATLGAYAQQRGYALEGYYDTLHPDQLRHLLCPDENIYLGSQPTAENTPIDLDVFMDKERLKAHKKILAENTAMAEKLLALATKELSQTKKHHNRLEKIYASAMDFSSSAKMIQEICSGYIKNHAVPLTKSEGVDP